MKKIKFMDTSFRDGFQSCYGARVKTEDFLPVLSAAVDAGNYNFEIGGGARFQSLYFYCQEDAFDMMDSARKIVGEEINLQTLARGVNVVGLESQSRDIVNLHAKLFKKHGITTIREPGGRGLEWALNLKKLSAENKIVAPRIFAYTSFGQTGKNFNPCAHAEILAIQKACKKLQISRLDGYDLFSSLEPCLMCSSIILQSKQ